MLSATWSSLDAEERKIASDFATLLRKKYPNTRNNIEEEKKVAQCVVDVLSFAWKFVNQQEQEQFSTLAREMREKMNLK